jgi:AcrR family transcriptional regulator
VATKTVKRARNTSQRPAKSAVVEADTRTRLVNAAAAEFNEQGFAGTDTNRIARRAGFAPQTFYRWFKDKTEIFVAVYQAWEDKERAVIDELLARKATTKQLIDATVSHHRDYLVFRRSLRRLSLEDPVIRAARADSRKRQLMQIRNWQQQADVDKDSSDGAIAAALLQMERLADALAEGELADMGISPSAAQGALAEIIERFRAR